MLPRIKILEGTVSFFIVSMCVLGGVYSISIQQYISAASLFVAAPTVPLALWYLSRIAKAQEQIIVFKQRETQSSKVDHLPPQDDGTMEQPNINPFHPPSVQ